MRTVLYWSLAASGIMTFTYDRIAMMSGVEVRWLVWLSAVTLTVGLIVGLYGKNNSVSEERVPVE